MKTIVALLATLSLAGCAAPGGGGFFDPQVVAGNERYVTVYDAMGLPGNSEQTAAAYCSKYGRYAQPQGYGGNAYQCAGRYAQLCMTYNCVQ